MSAKDGCVLVPQVGEEFYSFDVFQTRVFNYGKAAHVQFVKVDCHKIESAKMSKNTSTYPDKFVYRYVKFKCKHGGKHRSESKRALFLKTKHILISNRLLYLAQTLVPGEVQHWKVKRVRGVVMILPSMVQS